MKTMLLDVCCGPCAAGVIDQLTKDFDITLYFYSVNIYPEEEFKKRLESAEKLAGFYGLPLIMDVGDWGTEHKKWLKCIKGYENEPEGGKRCEKCFEFRLKQAERFARKNGFDKFTTTLSISPYKNADLVNRLGKKIDSKRFYEADFKKKDGFKKSVEKSRELGLYRQTYCGCEFSAFDDVTNL